MISIGPFDIFVIQGLLIALLGPMLWIWVTDKIDGKASRDKVREVEADIHLLINRVNYLEEVTMGCKKKKKSRK